VVIVPIGPGAERERVTAAAHDLARRLPELRVHVDDRPEYTPGWKYNDWEMRGVPLRIEVGPRDLAQGQAVLVRRDTGLKAPVATDEAFARTVAKTLDDIQATLFQQAKDYRTSMSRTVSTIAEIEEAGVRGLFWAKWCGEDACEAAVREATGATLRCLPEGDSPEGACLGCGRPAREAAVFARAY
jgi:prolyl-tRNA synthetase